MTVCMYEKIENDSSVRRTAVGPNFDRLVLYKVNCFDHETFTAHALPLVLSNNTVCFRSEVHLTHDPRTLKGAKSLFSLFSIFAIVCETDFTSETNRIGGQYKW